MERITPIVYFEREYNKEYNLIDVICYRCDKTRENYVLNGDHDPHVLRKKEGNNMKIQALKYRKMVRVENEKLREHEKKKQRGSSLLYEYVKIKEV